MGHLLRFDGCFQIKTPGQSGIRAISKKGLPFDSLSEILKSHGGKDDVCFKFNAGSRFCSFLTIGWGSCTQ